MVYRHRGSRCLRYVDWIAVMSENTKKYSNEELSKMNNDELARLGTELDGVTVAYRK